VDEPQRCYRKGVAHSWMLPNDTIRVSQSMVWHTSYETLLAGVPWNVATSVCLPKTYKRRVSHITDIPSHEPWEILIGQRTQVM